MSCRPVLRFERDRFVNRGLSLFEQAGFQREGRAGDAALNAAAPHPELEALPFVRRRVRLGHVQELMQISGEDGPC
jgi:hypothetical protein